MSTELKPFAVLMDAGAVFFAARSLADGLQLEYPSLSGLLCSQFDLLPPDPDQPPNKNRLWAMWTSFSQQNTGQVKFLEYAEQRLGWVARRFEPSDSYMIDPQTTLGISKSSDAGNSNAANRLIRFDASIAYTIGRIAETHKIVLISDSYALAEPLVKAAVAHKQKNYVAFFSRFLDQRWHGMLRKGASEHVEFFDLDAHETKLFGERRAPAANAWADDFAI